MKLKKILKWSAGALLLVLFGWFQIAYWTSTNECDRPAAVPTNPMKAVRNCEYGSPDMLMLDVVERPVPDDDHILVKVRANANEPVIFAVHLASAYIQYADRGKSSIILTDDAEQPDE